VCIDAFFASDHLALCVQGNPSMKAFWIILVSFAFLLPHTAVATKAKKPEPSPRERVEFVLNSLALKSQAFENSSLTNHVVVVEFFAYWCGVCRSIAPYYNEIYNARKARGLVYWGVHLGRDAKAEAYVTKAQLSFPIGYDEAETTLDLFESNVVPTIVVLDKKGELRFKGFTRPEGLEALVDKLLEEKE
jgi:thiol-disulfide isomerase/thioredoxin